MKKSIFTLFLLLSSVATVSAQSVTNKAVVANQSYVNGVCTSISTLAATVMQARQQNINPQQVKGLINQGLQKADTSLNNKIVKQTLSDIVDEAQLYPIYNTENEKKFLANAYSQFVLNRCKLNAANLVKAINQSK